MLSYAFADFQGVVCECPEGRLPLPFVFSVLDGYRTIVKQGIYDASHCYVATRVMGFFKDAQVGSLDLTARGNSDKYVCSPHLRRGWAASAHLSAAVLGHVTCPRLLRRPFLPGCQVRLR
jgi:hypothetical protein